MADVATAAMAAMTAEERAILSRKNKRQRHHDEADIAQGDQASQMGQQGRKRQENVPLSAGEKEQDSMKMNSATQTMLTIDEEQTSLVEGLITEGSRGRYRVEAPAGALWCLVRGRLRKELIYAESTSARRTARAVKVNPRDPVAIGDRVLARPTGPGEGVIERIVTRAGVALTRQDPDPGQRRLTMARGIEQIVIVFAAREPAPHMRLADRFTTLAEAQGAQAILCMNKADQGIEPWLRERLAVYAGLGYAVVTTSAATGEGVEDLRELLAGRVSALAGPSGVGKSSLLNALEPGLALRVSAISESTGKGRHTTTGTRMVALSGAAGGWLADTAGIRALALGELRNLPWLFREFRPLKGKCAFGNCRHLVEPDCAVIAAVRSGEIDAARYDSYRRLAGAGAWESADDEQSDGWDDPGEREEAWHASDG